MTEQDLEAFEDRLKRAPDADVFTLLAEVRKLMEYNQRLGDNAERALRQYAEIARENTALRDRLAKIRKLAQADGEQTV